MNKLKEKINSYYVDKFGEPWRVAVYKKDDTEVSIFAWTPEQTNEDVFIFATLGAFSFLGSSEQKCEFFFGLTSCPEQLPDSLAEVALDGNGTNNVPSSGDTITLSFNLWENTDARTYLFTDGGDEIIPPVKINDTKIKFIQLVPLFSNELDLKKRCGESALWQAFEEAHVPFWEADRRPLKV